MARALADIERDILELNQNQRTELLRKLIGDLDAPGDANSEAAWLKESERRLGEYRERNRSHISGGRRNKGSANAIEVMRLEVHFEAREEFLQAVSF
jgi:Putative addiction module component